MDWSLKDDGSDYRATCEIPEHYLWKININESTPPLSRSRE